MVSGKTKVTKKLAALGLGLVFALLVWLGDNQNIIEQANTNIPTVIVADGGGGVTLPPGGG
jgi:hypothetical protein